MFLLAAIGHPRLWMEGWSVTPAIDEGDDDDERGGGAKGLFWAGSSKR